jgi:nucleoside-diphosphate-sugar epimerase
MNVLVVGATGGSGAAAARALLSAGHRVTAFARSPETLEIESSALSRARGDVTNARDVLDAVEGHDAVIVTLGIRENPLAVRVRGPKRTPMNVRSEGTRIVIEAMRARGVDRLVVQTTYGVGETYAHLSVKWKLLFSLVIAPQLRDTERQEAIVRASPLDWVLVRPVGLHDGPPDPRVFVSSRQAPPSMEVSRARVGELLAEAATRGDHHGEALVISAA